MLKVEPQNPRTGVPITVTASSSDTLTVSPVEKKNGEPFEVKWKETSGTSKHAEFVLMVPGDYLIRVGSETEKLNVELQRDLSFLIEFGLLASLVLFFLAGIIIWTKKKKSLT